MGPQLNRQFNESTSRYRKINLNSQLLGKKQSHEGRLDHVRLGYNIIEKRALDSHHWISCSTRVR